MNEPLISIVLCTYNGERFIGEQVESLIHQSYKNIEIIISDDASTDNTVAILEKYRDHPVIKLFLQSSNTGSGKNFEFALKQARGGFIAFSDQDDTWLPEKIQKMFDAIGDSYLLYSDSELVNESGESLHKKLSQLRRMYTGDQTTGFVFSNVVWGHAMFINRKLLGDILPIPAGIPHDGWMGFRAATITGIKYLDIPLTKYRQHEATVTKTIAVKAEPRSAEKRYKDFEEKLYWIGIMRDHERSAYKPFYSRLYDLYKRKGNGRYVWTLFFFLLSHRKEFFMFTRKKWLSQVIEMLKQARGESKN
jgi:glycosyltransferase involved in cell wall biosynthesis